MAEFLYAVLGIYAIGLVLHGFVMSFWWMAGMEQHKLWPKYSDPPELSLPEVVIWTAIWPIADILVIAKWLAPGVESMWRRL